MESRALRISIVVAGIILVIIILIITFFSKNSTIGGKKTLTPTPIENNYQKNNSATSNTTNNNQNGSPKTSTGNGANNYYEDSNFSVRYDSATNGYVIDQKNSQAGEKITEWLAQHPELGQNVTIVKNNIDNKLVSSSSASVQDITLKNTLVGLLKILTFPIFNATNSSSVNSSNPASSSAQQSNTANSFVYYPQCNGPYDNYPLPSGCNICNAGCGPVTVAMITASYVDSQIKPPTVVDKYKEKNQPLSCAGSGFSSAKMVLESYGLRTSDYLFSYGLYPIDDVASDFKNYLKSGWTIFALANFKASGGGHYFWITDIDGNDNVWAYDPYYGRYQAPPLNENSRYPFPKYKIAFAVKKK